MRAPRTPSDPDLFDANGFLRDADRWGRDLAIARAQQLGVGPLLRSHWSVIGYLREHYLICGSLPWEGNVCRELDLADHCIHQLFGGPLEAWKIAGLPDPGEEARAYMENMEP
jgi:tRNA 2-thiouridine synthesizing protein E